MNEEPYFFKSSESFRYSFTSVSAQKEVQKLVDFTPTAVERLYNLSLLDVLPDGSTSDVSETKNRDMRTVLATVVQIILDFFSRKPDSFVFIQGSDASVCIKSLSTGNWN